MAQTANGDQLCPDWIFSNNSNAHACKSRGWFTEYTPFNSKAGTIYTREENIVVAGIGTVVLPVKKAPKRTGPNAHGQLILHDVLHTPNSVCNILGLADRFLEDYPKVTMGFAGDTRGDISDASGRKVAYFVEHPVNRLAMVKLSGPPVGPRTSRTGFREGGHHFINVSWSDAERDRWEAYQQQNANSFQQGSNEPLGQAPYTTEEKQWLKKHYSGEFHFLRAHGLSILSEDDRQEGRAIARGFINDEASKGEKHDPAFETQSLVPNISGAEEYTREERRWLKIHYGDERNLLAAENLKMSDEEQREAGRAIVRSFMAAEGPEGKQLVDDMLGSDDDGEAELNDEGIYYHSDEDDDEGDLEGHMADYHFDEKTLHWIEKHYGNSMNFMMSMGLKFYDEEDCEEAKAIAEAMMRPDTPE